MAFLKRSTFVAKKFLVLIFNCVGLDFLKKNSASVPTDLTKVFYAKQSDDWYFANWDLN